MLVLRLGHEREGAARVERRVRDRLGPKRDAGYGHDPDPRVLPRDSLTGRGVAQVVAGAPPVPFEPEAETLSAQSSFWTAATTRATEGT